MLIFHKALILPASGPGVFGFLSVPAHRTCTHRGLQLLWEVISDLYAGGLEPYICIPTALWAKLSLSLWDRIETRCLLDCLPPLCETPANSDSVLIRLLSILFTTSYGQNMYRTAVGSESELPGGSTLCIAAPDCLLSSQSPGAEVCGGSGWRVYRRR